MSAKSGFKIQWAGFETESYSNLHFGLKMDDDLSDTIIWYKQLDHRYCLTRFGMIIIIVCS